MRKHIALILVALFAFAASAIAQDATVKVTVKQPVVGGQEVIVRTNGESRSIVVPRATVVLTDEEIPDCKLGKAPVNTNRTPTDGEQPFIAPKGAVVIMHFKRVVNGRQLVDKVRCRMPYDVLSWAIDKSLAWDQPSGNNFESEEWEIPYDLPEGPQGPPGPQGLKGDKGDPGRDGVIVVQNTQYQDSPALTGGSWWRRWWKWVVGTAAVVVTVVGGTVVLILLCVI